MSLATIAGAVAAGAAVAIGAAPLRHPVSRRPPTNGGQSSDRRRELLGPRAAAGIGLIAVLILAMGTAAVLLVAAVIVGVAVARRRNAARSAARAVDAAMPDAIELLVVCLHAGLTPAQAAGEMALRAPQAVRHGFVATEQRLHRGASFAEALTELRRQLGPCAATVEAALGTAVRDGLPLAPVLDRLGDEANAARRRAGEAAARRLPVRLSFPLVVCTLPSFVLLAIVPAVIGALSTVRSSVL